MSLNGSEKTSRLKGCCTRSLGSSIHAGHHRSGSGGGFDACSTQDRSTFEARLCDHHTWIFDCSRLGVGGRNKHTPTRGPPSDRDMAPADRERPSIRLYV